MTRGHFVRKGEYPTCPVLWMVAILVQLASLQEFLVQAVKMASRSREVKIVRILLIGDGE
jgi:hypothetical protein